MVSIKALGAIALTLIIVVPIGLGYALAVEDEEVTYWESSDTRNISESLLNSESDYYNTYNGPNNNSLFYVNYTPEESAVKYVKTGTTATSLPIYTYKESSAQSGSTTSKDYALNGTGIGSADSTTILSYSLLELFSGSSLNLYVGGALKEWGTLGTVYIQLDPQTSVYTVLTGNDEYEGTSWKLEGTGTVSATWATGNPVDVTVDALYSTSQYAIVVAKTSTETIEAALNSNEDIRPNPRITNGNFWIGSTDYGPLQSLVIYSLEDLLFYTQVSSGRYADSNYGWQLYTSHLGGTSATWYNGFSNSTVQISMQIVEGAKTQFQLIGDDYGAFLISKTDGTVTVTQGSGTYVVGEYNSLLLTISESEITVAGTLGWVTMTSTPTTFNTVTLDSGAGAISQIALTELVSASKSTFRVDSAQVVAGSFASTKDMTYDPNAQYPDKSYTVILNSFAFYGNTFGFAGENYTVTDGKIAVDGKEIALRGIKISSWVTEDGTYENKLDSVVVNTTETPATIYFGGEWSLTAQRMTMEEVTDTELRWQPGVFAFTKDDFIACGLIVCALAFIGLGLTGRASSGKALLLALICGGAGLGLLTLL